MRSFRNASPGSPVFCLQALPTGQPQPAEDPQPATWEQEDHLGQEKTMTHNLKERSGEQKQAFWQMAGKAGKGGWWSHDVSPGGWRPRCRGL